jgi:hypothetical protein
MSPEYTPPPYRQGDHIQTHSGAHGIVRHISRGFGQLRYWLSDQLFFTHDEVRGLYETKLTPWN